MIGGVEMHEIKGMKVVRLADIQALPMWQDFEPWIIGQTCLHYSGESWVYLHDWQRFLRGGSPWPPMG